MYTSPAMLPVSHPFFDVFDAAKKPQAAVDTYVAQATATPAMLSLKFVYVISMEIIISIINVST